MSKLASNKKIRLISCALMAIFLAGCANTTGNKSSEKDQPAKTSKQSGKSARKETASQSAAGERKVKGRGDWEGYISGQPWKGAKFSRLQIGMSYREVLSLIGGPTDQYSHVTGKAWIPYYFGSGRYEHKLLYKGQGRLVFAGDAGFSSNAHLIGIEFNRNESGYQ